MNTSQLPTEVGWHPEVCARGDGYLPGALRIVCHGKHASPPQWMVVTVEGHVMARSDNWVEVVLP